LATIVVAVNLIYLFTKHDFHFHSHCFLDSTHWRDANRTSAFATQLTSLLLSIQEQFVELRKPPALQYINTINENSGANEAKGYKQQYQKVKQSFELL
jgi:hypothetical protein